jgi:hypothetical protein
MNRALGPSGGIPSHPSSSYTHRSECILSETVKTY